MGLEGIVSKRLGSRYSSGRCRDWLKFKNPDAPAVKREAEEEWGPKEKAMTGETGSWFFPAPAAPPWRRRGSRLGETFHIGPRS